MCEMDINDIVKIDMTNIGRYSFSKLSTYETCQYQYEKVYIEKCYREKNPMSEFGTFVHGLLESYFKKQKTLDDIIQEFKNSMYNSSDSVYMYIPKSNDDYIYKDITDSYFDNTLAFLLSFNGFDDYEVLDVENYFQLLLEYNDEKFIFCGIIDLIMEKNNNIYIVDHKSKGKFKNKIELKKYTMQLALYSIYVEYKFGKKPKELWFNQFRIGEIKKIKVTDELIQESLIWSSNVVKNIKGENLFLPNTSDKFYCKNLCDVRNECVYFNNSEG